MSYKVLTHCRLCRGMNLTQWLDLGHQPLANRLLSRPDEPCARYPLEVFICEDCWLSQLSVVVDPKEMFTDYPFRSSVSASWRNHCQWLARKVAEYGMRKDKLALDIGANDGCLLGSLAQTGMQAAGVEPSPFVDPYFAYNRVGSYWDLKTAQEVVNLCGSAYLVTATNVLAHVNDLREFLEAVRRVINEDGIFYLEVPYVGTLLANIQFDTVYHEHLSYFSLAALVRLLREHKFKILWFDYVDIHGGSLAIVATPGYMDNSVALTEDQMGLINKSRKFQMQVRQLVGTFREAIAKVGESVAAYGASAKGTVFLNYCGFKPEAVFDDTPHKQGRFIPGVGVPILPPADPRLKEYDYLLVLSWNVYGDIKEQARKQGFRGKFICRKDTRIRIE